MSAKTDKFINKLAPIARNEYLSRTKWVLPSVCIAQAALETGWGTSSLMTKANAYFGIKATGWRGKVYNSATLECYDGKTYTNINACFRAYDSVEDSVKDYYDLITKSSRYSKAVNNSDANATITAIKNGGYATDPGYINKIIKIIDQYGLRKYDDRGANIKPSQSLKTNEEIATEVIQGKWGVGTARTNALEKAGYDAKAIQAIVNARLNKTTTSPQQKRTYTVVRGDSLWKIAQTQLGKGSRYPEIVALNGIVSNKIYPGQVLKLPIK